MNDQVLVHVSDLIKFANDLKSNIDDENYGFERAQRDVHALYMRIDRFDSWNRKENHWDKTVDRRLNKLKRFDIQTMYTVIDYMQIFNKDRMKISFDNFIGSVKCAFY